MILRVKNELKLRQVYKKVTINEQKAVASLAFIMICRMLGLFLILPIFSHAAVGLLHATPSLIGFALGVYGFTQACLQIPMGTLSDRIGRKPVIVMGLIIFALGSVIAALSHSIYGVIIGRAVQGAGAIGSTVLALAADLTPDENRSKAMAFIGLAIGTSFMLAMILGPALNQWIHLAGIFWVICCLSLFCVLLVYTILPTPPLLVIHPNTEYQGKQLRNVLNNSHLLRLNLGIFTIHAMLTATFIGVPVLFSRLLHVSQYAQVILYLVLLPVAFLLIIPFLVIGEKKRKLNAILLGAIVVLIFSQLLLTFLYHSALIIILALLLFFAAFTLLEATLPSLVSKISPIQRKGTAMGVYSTCQFLGIFIGGSCGGLIFSHYQFTGIFLFSTILGLIWFCFALSLQHPPYLTTFIFSIKNLNSQQANKLQHWLLTLNGIYEIAAMHSEKLIYIKADKKIIDKEQLRKLIDESTLHQLS